MPNWMVVANFSSGLEADIAVERLRSEGIAAHARGRDIVGIVGPGFQGTTARGVDVVVQEAWVADAREILEPLTNDDDAPSDP